MARSVSVLFEPWEFLFFRLPAPTGTFRSVPPAVQYRMHEWQRYRGCFAL